MCESDGAFARFSFCTGDCSPLVFCPEVLKEIHLVNSTCCTVHADCISSGVLQMRRGHFVQRCVFKENSVGMSTSQTSILAHLKAKILVCVCVCVCVR